MEFRCNSCGLCCQVVGVMVSKARGILEDANLAGMSSMLLPIVPHVAAFPHSFDAGGRCEKLGEDNRCTVYHSRPEICSVEDTRKRYYKELSKKDFYEHNERVCRVLQGAAAGVTPKVEE